MRYFTILAVIVAVALLGGSSPVPITDHGTGLDNRPETTGSLPHHLNAKRCSSGKTASTNNNTLRKRGTLFGVYYNLVKQNLWYGMPWSPDWKGWDNFWECNDDDDPYEAPDPGS